ncbi:glycoside hydrolase family 2 protein [Paenibacillus sp. OV219]|uniref:glycoside hydrolase family 2 protein n=1 Tax=Paenibacillus sp. OV219 TaxID=1884377 RepID=UPI0008C7ADA2|nr:glycoside hydrolase family 2 TIM barrel-domain containing protein [Paenibacillus sp. OV219]SEO74283.1 Glycosyl hydrolases family 2 [Paenibacillus sp. OV219]
MTAQALTSALKQIPRPEYPRPDWQRQDWLNLNGTWEFRLDTTEVASGYETPTTQFDSEIIVPFSWASPLSGIGRDERGTGWYKKSVAWSPAESNSRVFLRFGAADYSSEVWVNGTHVGSHIGGYGGFEFDVTHVWRSDAENAIIVSATDFDHGYQARGKQGYGEIRGIWQPVWLEARPQSYIQSAKFATFINGTIGVKAVVVAHEAGEASLQFSFDGGTVQHNFVAELVEGENEVSTSFVVSDPQLWSPETPYLYEGSLTLSLAESAGDVVSTYFGIREFGTALFGDRSYRWVTLNGKPIYLNGTLDQSYHQTGYFTYPTDDEMQDEIYLLKRLGLNLVRIHIKPEEPRKLYWADKLGMLVMEDMPCFWGNPDETARANYESEAKEIIERDYNHPSIFSWVMFNETWGLKTNPESQGLTNQSHTPSAYLPETQEWVRGIYHWAKELDPTRIVEDNSPCNFDHVETDLNTWHFYINGYEQLREHVTDVVGKTYPGSSFNCIGGNVQGDAPLMNSECGNVWGFSNGAGDSDLAWHYWYMMNEFRRHDKMCGFVFTEFRDVTNEFNGYYRLDGSDKQFGYEDLVPGMSLSDLHTPDYIVIDAPPCQTVQAGEQVSVSLLASSYSDAYHGQQLTLAWELTYDNIGVRVTAERGSVELAWSEYGVKPIEAPIVVNMPKQDAVAVLAVRLVDAAGRVVTRNFTTFDVRSGAAHGVYEAEGQFVQVPVTGFASHSFPHQWNAIQEGKTNGGSEGEFVYDVELPSVEEQGAIHHIEIAFEASAKRLLARNIEGSRDRQHGIDFMHGANANVEYNSNTYYMTDDEQHPSHIVVSIDGEQVGTFTLPDNPSDSRGVLSYQYQEIYNKLDEAGSYGYLCRITMPSRIAAKLNRSRSFKLAIAADHGGVALYGRNAGRYPLDILVRVK